MSDIDQLTGVELRKAVAEAVGWEWIQPHGFEGYAWIRDTDETHLFSRKISWDDAIAACEAAGIKGNDDFQILIQPTRILIEYLDPRHSWQELSYAVGSTPESLCHALLKALAAKKESSDGN
jgi:hypothetical protein